MAIYPSGAASDSDLYVAVNNKNTTLVGALTATGGNYSATEIEVADTTGFPSTGLITIDLEIISYTGVATSPHRFTGITRGQDGSTAVSHINGASVIHTVVAAHHNVLKDEVKALEADLITSRPKWFNYIANGAAANDTTGWATYADAAGTSPVDGSGGSPTITWTRSTSSPLRGLASFVLTKGAANRQGEGVSYDFTIDSADRAKPLYVSFTYLPDTNYADDDIRVWLYDVTNAVLIQPAPYLLKDVLNAESWKGVFQTASNSSSYRLIIHIGSTNASAYTVKFDDLRISPEYGVMGSPITDWQTVTLTGGWTTNTTYVAKSRRVGDFLEVDGVISLTGAPNATSCTINLPAGYAIDNTKMGNPGNEAVVGYALISDASPTTYIPGTILWNSTTQVVVRSYAETGTNVTANGVTNTQPFTFASGDKINFRFMVPIVGWSSSTIMSDNADTRVVAAQYRRTSNQTGILDSTSTIIDADVKDIDTHGAVTTGASWKFTAPVSGNYSVYATLGIGGGVSWAASGEIAQIILYKNGASQYVLMSNYPQVATTARIYVAGGGLIQLNAGDYIDFRIQQTSGETVTIAGSTIILKIERLSGPSQIAATETVAARYTYATGNTTYNVATMFDFGTKIFDTHGAVSGAGGGMNTTPGSGWKFTAPVSGLYRVSSSLSIGPTNPGVAAVGIGTHVYKNSSLYAVLADYTNETTTTSQYFNAVGSTIVPLNAGDSIQVACLQTIGNPNAGHNGASRNWVDVERIGNYA